MRTLSLAVSRIYVVALTIYGVVRAQRIARTGDEGWIRLTDTIPREACGNRLPHPDRSLTRISVAAVRWSPVGAKCLERSYGICYALRKTGVAASLVVGVSHRPPISFHAWVEVNSEVVNDRKSYCENYRELCRI